jgi:hypothetical protein
MRICLVSLCAATVSLLAGCGASLTDTAAPVAAHIEIQGTVFGGQQPVVGARVYLLAADTTGYGNASAYLLNNTSLSSDSNSHFYVSTGSDGSFSLAGDFTACSSGSTTQVYIYALGGNPGAGSNSASGMMAALGTCANITSSTHVALNEVSTVAAAYAMAGYAVDATHVSSSGTTLAQTGIANAFANSGNLVGLASGTALTTTPGGNGTVPYQTIYTLSNILAACINSADTVVNTVVTHSGACNTLLTTATADGTSSGTQPTDTATAMINIAHHPGANVHTLYTLPTGTPPYSSHLGSQPNDFSIGIQFTGTATSLYEPDQVAIDAAGNVWVTGVTKYYLGELNNQGVLINSYSYGTSNFTAPGIALDTSGDAWIADQTNSYIVEVNSSGTVSSNAFSGSVYMPFDVALDASGNLWTTNGLNKRVAKISSPGPISGGTAAYTGIVNSTLTSIPSAIAIDGNESLWAVAGSYVAKYNTSAGTSTANYSLSFTGQVLAIDNSNNVWVANYTASPTTVTVLGNSTGTAVTGFPVSVSSLNYTLKVAIDGAGNAWFTSLSPCNCVMEVSSSGTVLTSTGLTGGSILGPNSVAIDGSGDIWVANQTSGASYTVSELIGAASPVVTPIVSNLVSPYTHPASRP